MFDKIKLFILNNFLFLLILLLLFLFFEQNKVADVPIRPLARASAPLMPISEGGFSDEKFIKTYSVELEVGNIEKTKDIVNQRIKEFSGEVSNFSSFNKTYIFNIRIPSEFVHNFLANIKKLGNIRGERNTENDFREIYKNNENRLKTLYDRKKRLEDMFKDTKTPVDIDRELSFVENDILTLENNNRNINNDVDFVKIDVVILQELGSNWKFRNSWNSAVLNLIRFCERSVDLMFNLVLFSPIIVLIWFVNKKMKK